CWASQQRCRAHTDEEYAEMLLTLALPGRDWRYTATESRSRLQITDMTPAAKGWAATLRAARTRRRLSCLAATSFMPS
ncbi:hypothetical protein A2U01_0092129, partial [Trifolium medium]|nr:hypothetical protein [Trifolium medium]